LKSIEDISYLLRSAHPITLVSSFEETRVTSAIRSLLVERNRARRDNTGLYCWTITEGLVDQLSIAKNCAVADTEDPMAALVYIREFSAPGVFILKDLVPLIEDSHILTRMLKDLAYSFSESGTFKRIILLDHRTGLPPDLEKISALVEFDLPDRGDVEARVEAIVMSSRQAALADEKERLKNPDELNKVVTALTGLTVFEIDNIIAKCIVQHRKLDPTYINREKRSIIRKSGVLDFYESEGDMTLVGGLTHLKAWVATRGKAFSPKAKDFGLPAPKGLLLVGVPGTGKSLVAKTIGRAWSMPVLKLDMGSLFNMYVGESEANMRKALQTAEALAPCVLWIDEIEKSVGSGNDGGTSVRVLGHLLNWMQEKKKEVFVVATANDVSKVPPEMLRKGRFDEMFFVDLPTPRERADILRIHITRFGRAVADFDVDKVIEHTEKFSGAELEQVVVSALFSAFDADREITTEDLVISASELVPIAETMSRQIVELREWAKTKARLASITAEEENEVTGKVRPLMPRFIGRNLEV
jgi:cytidylate kinase